MFINVLVGVDGRQGGCDAIALAEELAAPGARITLAHVDPRGASDGRAERSDRSDPHVDAGGCWATRARPRDSMRGFSRPAAPLRLALCTSSQAAGGATSSWSAPVTAERSGACSRAITRSSR